MEDARIDPYGYSQEEPAPAAAPGWWSQRLPLLVVALAVIIMAVGIFLDREEMAYWALGRDVPGTITGVKSLADAQQIPGAHDYGPFLVTYTFSIGAGQPLVEGQHIYEWEAPETDGPFSVQYLSTDPQANRPFGSKNSTTFELFLILSMTVLILGFMHFLGRDGF